MNSGLTLSGGSVNSSNNSDEGILSIETIVKVVKQLALFLVIYSVGYFGLSILWAYIIAALIILNYKWAKEKRARTQVLQAMSLGYEQEIIVNSLRQIPSWVRFPEIEKVEWANRLFKHIWGEVNQYAQELVPKILEPVIQKYVADFKFEKIVLGNVPIRIDGIKVYDQENHNKVVLDLDVSYAGDCYVTFQTFKFTGGIKDIQLYGRLRVVLTPLISKIPIIGGIQVYYIKEPRIDFDLIKITHILDVPVIRNKIKSTIMKVLNSTFLSPNVFSLKLNKRVNMSKLSTFKVDGILRVHVVEAQNLVNKDFIGKSDPYVVLNLGSIKRETQVIQNCLNPKWDYWCEFESEANSELNIQVWDKDDGFRDETLGHTKIDVGLVAKNGEANLWRKLDGVVQGTIHIRLTWLSLTTHYLDLDAAMRETELLSPLLHSALLMVYLDSSIDLPILSKSLPNPYVELRVENNVKSTEIEKCTSGPIWEKGFTFMVKDPNTTVLDLRIWDDESKRSLGDLCYKIDNLKEYPFMEIRSRTFLLNQSASITMSLQLKIFKNESLEETNEEEKSSRYPLVKQNSEASTKSKASRSSFKSEDSDSTYSEDTESAFSLSFDQNDSNLGSIKLSLSYSVQRQKLVIVVHELDLPLTTSPNLDIYVKMYIQTDKHKNNKRKTKVVKNTYSPVFDETFEYLVSGKDLGFSRLKVEVVAEKNIFNLGKKFLGKIVIALDRSNNLNEPFTHWFNLMRKKSTNMYHLN